MPDTDSFDDVKVPENPGTESLDPGAEVGELHGVVCHLVGEQDCLPDFFPAKRRKDEEDYWPDLENEEEERLALKKAQTESQSMSVDSADMIEILDPPLSLTSLVQAFEESNSLRQNVDAMVTNVDGFGFTLLPVIDFESIDFRSMVSDQIEESGVQLSEEAVSAKMLEIQLLATREKRKLKQFFAFCADESFIELRRASREDLEALGNFAWEVLRDENGQVRRFVHVPFYTVRLVKRGKEGVEVTVKRKIDPITYAEYKEKKKFRRFVQLIGGKRIFFKEFGDPRPMSKKTGRYFEDEVVIKELMSRDPDEGIASEMIHYKIRALRGSYGLPRWIGNLLSVLGSRLAEEVNFFYFNNKGIPPMIIFVENGRLRDGAADKLADFMKQVKGDTKKFWKVAVLEGESSDEARRRGIQFSGQPRFKVVKLSSEQLKDALFQEYDERNRDKVGESWRMPRLLRGDTRDFNRACYSEDTETLTENGWKLWHEIASSERIAAFSPETGRIEFVVPEKRHVYNVQNEEMIRFANSHTDCLVTPDHKMLVQSGQTRAENSEWIESQAKDIPFDRFNVKMAADSWCGDKPPDLFHLPKSCGCKIERGHDHECDVKFDDWLEFLGYWISEGGILQTDHPAAPYLVYLAQKKQDVREMMRACLDRLGWSYSTQEEPDGLTRFTLSNRCLRDWLAANCGTHSHNKQIPWEYLRLDAHSLEVLLGALWAGDGTVDVRPNRTSRSYYSSSTVLAGQVQQILVQIGFRATVVPGSRRLRVLSCESRTTQLRRTGSENTPTSVTTERYTGRVYCFSVPDFGFFVTRRNGKIAIQGNTAETAKSFGEEQVFQPERDRFDAWIDRVIGPELDMTYWIFRTLAPVVRDPISLTQMVETLMKASVLVPKEGRKIAEDIFNRDFADIPEKWVTQPIALTLVEAAQSKSDVQVAPIETGNAPQDLSKKLEELGLGGLGKRVDVGVISRLLEIHRELSAMSVLPDSETED